MKSLARLYAIVRKEFLQIRRDRLTMGMVVGMPLMQLLLFGYAINTDVRNLNAAVADQASTHLSHEAVTSLAQSQVVNIVQRVETPQALMSLLARGDIAVGIHLPPDFDQRVARGDRTAGQLLVDGSDPTILGVASQLARMPIQFDAQRNAARADAFEVRAFYNPEGRTAVNIVPGLLGVILTMTMVLFTAVAIVREREAGNLELLITTPISTAELMVAKVFPYVLIGLTQISLLLLLGKVLFALPMRGSLFDLYLGALAFITANLALGLLISTAIRTQFQAMQATMFVFLPSMLLSGFMFPFDGMPKFAQHIGELIPLTHFIRIVKGVMLRGASLVDVAPAIQALTIIAAVLMTGAILRFRKKLD
ncbi:MAG: ABC transporter permease [Pseudomonadota bacterium]